MNIVAIPKGTSYYDSHVNTIIHLQKIYKIKMVRRSLLATKLDNSVIANNTFDTFQTIIQDKYLINNVDKFINRLVNGSKKHCVARELLVTFVIAGYPETVFDNITDDLVVTLIKVSKNIVYLYDSFYKSINDVKIKLFKNYMTQFNELFNKWKERDLKKVLEPMIFSYFELEETKKIVLNEKYLNPEKNLNPDALQFINLCNGLQNKLTNYMKKIDGLKYFNKFKSINYDMSPNEYKKLHNIISETMHKAYWNVLLEELESTPPKYNQLIKIVDEVKLELIDIVVIDDNLDNTEIKLAKQNIITEINENIDTELMRQMLDNNAMSDEEIYKMLLYIVGLVKRLEAPFMDQDTVEWMNQLNLQNEELKFALINYFIKLFNKIKTIKNQLSNFKQSDMYAYMLELNNR
jgi:hypothetical protein